VNAVSNNDYLLVLMDMRLPGMDGITATQEIRRVEREGRTCSEKPCTIIAMTADASSELREKVRKSFGGRYHSPFCLNAFAFTPRRFKLVCKMS